MGDLREFELETSPIVTEKAKIGFGQYVRAWRILNSDIQIRCIR